MFNKCKDIKFEILMDAGLGVQSIGDILSRVFVKSGKNIFVESIIPAEIKPPIRSKKSISGIIIRVANFELNNAGSEIDFILASHEIALDSQIDNSRIKKGGCVILDLQYKKNNLNSYKKVCGKVIERGLDLALFEIENTLKKEINLLSGRGRNIFYLGIVSSILNMPKNIFLKEINDYFKNKISKKNLKKNEQFFIAGYNFAYKNIRLSYKIKNIKNKKSKILLDGGLALGSGIIDSGIKLCTGYPITPAFNIMQFLAKEFPLYGGVMYQSEDEISAIGTAIGAYFGGLPAVTCTSGPGLSLKQEFIGFASVAEIPVIVIDIQRAGPSTGMPTKTEQSDLLAIIFGSHGDNVKVVISVADSTDCFYAPHLARYLAEKLRLPVFIVGDFQIMNNYKEIDMPRTSCMKNSNKIKDLILNNFRISRLPNKIEMVHKKQKNLFGKFYQTSGLNVNKFGSIDYSSEANIRSHKIRNEKLRIVSEALQEPEFFGKKRKGDFLIVAWGSTRGVLKEAVEKCCQDGFLVTGMHLKIVYPLPSMIKDIFSNFKSVATIEIAYGDKLKPAPLASLLRMHTGVIVNSIISQPTGRPLELNNVVQKIKETLNNKKYDS